MQDIGGFFAVLRMNTDDASFAKGAGALTNIATILKGFALLKVGEGMMQLLSAMSKINEQQAALNTTSAQIGVSVMELKTWQVMADMVGGSADGMAQSLKGLMDITANLGRGITPDNQKFIDMMGILGITKWQGRAPTDLAQNMIDNAMSKIQHFRTAGDKVGEARVRNAVEAMFGPSGNALLTAGLAQGWTTQQMLSRAGIPLMTNQRQIQGAIGPMVDMNLFNQTVKESESLFAMKFMASVDPELKAFLAFIVSNKGEITTTLSDLASVFGAMAREMLGFLKTLVEAAVITDELLHGKVDKTRISKMGEDLADLLIPGVVRDWANEKGQFASAAPAPWEMNGGRMMTNRGFTGFQNPPPVRIIIEDKTQNGIRTRGIEHLNHAADTLLESGG